MTKALIFDFDGTIANSFEQAIQILYEIQYKAGFNYTKKELTYILRNNTTKQLINKFKISKLKLLILIFMVRKKFKEHQNSLKPYVEIKTTLEELSKHYDLYLLTSNNKDIVEEFLTNNDLQYFKKKYCRVGLLSKAKKMEHVIKKLNLNKDSAFYIGDEVRDFKASNEVGITPLIATWGYHSKELLKKNHIPTLINNPKELISYFK